MNYFHLFNYLSSKLFLCMSWTFIVFKNILSKFWVNKFFAQLFFCSLNLPINKSHRLLKMVRIIGVLDSLAVFIFDLYAVRFRKFLLIFLNFLLHLLLLYHLIFLVGELIGSLWVVSECNK